VKYDRPDGVVQVHLVPLAELRAEFERDPRPPTMEPAEVEAVNRVFAELQATWRNDVHHRAPDAPCPPAREPRSCARLARPPMRGRCPRRRPASRRPCASRHAERGDPDPDGHRRVSPITALLRARTLLQVETGDAPDEVVALLAHRLLAGVELGGLEVAAVLAELALRRARGGEQ
jgi:hypothetical protein